MSEQQTQKPKPKSTAKAPDYKALAGLGRDERMEQAGWKLMDVPDGAVMLTQRGGQQLLGVAEGDDVELYADAEGKGMWKSGFVALSGVMPGEMGGPYDGEDVVWVGKAHRQGEKGEKRGDEWPARYLRLARGRKPTFQDDGEAGEDNAAGADRSDMDTGAEPEPEQSAGFTTTAAFYRRDQRRYPRGHPKGGQWIEEGAGDDPAPGEYKYEKGAWREYDEDQENDQLTWPHEREAGKLGIQADYEGNVFMAERANQALRRMKDEGYPLPAYIRAVEPQSETQAMSAAWYHMPRFGGEPGLNLNSAWVGWRSAEAYTKAWNDLHANGWVSTPSDDHVLIHELAHHLSVGQMPLEEGLELQRQWRFGGALHGNDIKRMKEVAARVSRYAASNPVEFVAETFTGLLLGREYDNEVLALYDLYEGPYPKGKERKR